MTVIYYHILTNNSPRIFEPRNRIICQRGFGVQKFSPNTRLRKKFVPRVKIRFWKRIVTSDEKWVYLVNHDRSKRWVPKGQTSPSVPKQNQFGKKVMICVWWNFEGILHFELVPKGRAINAELYCDLIESSNLIESTMRWLK